MKTSRLARAGLALTVLGASAALVYVLSDSGRDCPVGSQAVKSPHSRNVCLPLKGPERPQEILQANDRQYQKAGLVPEGAFRRAIEHKKAMEGLKLKVAGAAGRWAEYGVGQLDDASGSFQSARVDNFAYDPAAKRLFAAIGTGGVWMSEAVGGDIRTLADNWVSIGDKLPSQIGSGIAWTPAGGGTLVFAGGESVMGSSGYLGLGAFWTNDLGQTWNQASGIPDGALVFRAAADPVNTSVIYVASSKGLFRSEDAGRTYRNVLLPTTVECAGVETLGPCQFTNYVTDVVIKQPGGTTGVTCDPKGCPVLAGVGFRTGSSLAFQDGRAMAPGNGLYRSNTGEVGSFTELVDAYAIDNNLPVGFLAKNRIGRIELAEAFGDAQDHNYVYAIVQDSVLFNGGLVGVGGDPVLDAILNPILGAAPTGIPSYFGGIYVSADFGDTWTRMADTAEIATPGATGSEIGTVGAAVGSGAGIQAWYNAWIAVDPTRALGAVPTRMTFGLEEVWQSRVTNAPLNGIAQAGPSDFNVIGTYFNLAGVFPSTTHADQHAGLYIPTGDGGVCLFVGNDGGIYKQCKDGGEEMDNSGWGEGANGGIYALLPYGLAVAKDGTVWWGLQDNGSGLIDPFRDNMIFQTMGGDGFYAEVDPDNSDIAYTETQNGGLTRTTNRGGTNTDIAPTYTRVMFDNWFRMDPLNPQHMVTAAQEVYETDNAQTVTGTTWVEVFNLGTNPATGAIRTTTTIDVLGDAVYVGGCGDCGASGNDTGFQNVLATNVGGSAEPQAETPNGWHFATAAGLPNRYITAIAIDPNDPRTIYLTLGGYLSNLRPQGSYLDPNASAGSGAVFKSTDAGESFTNISGNLPDAQAATVIVRGNQLLVGTDVGAFISTDLNGQTWSPLGNGLPAVPVNMLRLQPGDPNLLFAATFGRGVWFYDFGTSVDNPAPPAVVPTTPDTDKGRFGNGALPLLSLVVLLLAAGLRRRP